jgi:hypothetical protein
MHHKVTTLFSAALLALTASPALAEYGSVKVECGSSCLDVVVGEVCDAYVQHSRPVAIACDDTATPGYGRTSVCGNGTCTSYGTLLQSDPVGAYCAAGRGNDAIVTCVYPPPEPPDVEDDDEYVEPGAEDKIISGSTSDEQD